MKAVKDCNRMWRRGPNDAWFCGRKECYDEGQRLSKEAKAAKTAKAGKSAKKVRKVPPVTPEVSRPSLKATPKAKRRKKTGK
jgi:hypothetical protein